MREIYRKVVHLLVGLSLLFLALFIRAEYSLDVLKLFLLALLMASLFIDFLIADLKIKIPIYEMVERKKELSGLHSSSFFLIGCLLAIQFFTFEVALAAISMLVFGDAMAALIGRKWGKPFYKKKSLLGSTAMFLTSTLVGIFFLANIWVVLAMAFIGTLVEVFVNNIDDNLMIPLFAGLCGHLLLLLF
jgi:dolichol kinase